MAPHAIERSALALVEVGASFGSLASGSRAIGRSRNFLTNVRSRRTVRFDALLEAIEMLGLEPLRFHQWADGCHRAGVSLDLADQALEVALENHGLPVLDEIRLAFLRGALPHQAADEIGSEPHGSDLRDKVRCARSAIELVDALDRWAEQLADHPRRAWLVRWTAVRIAGAAKLDEKAHDLAAQLAPFEEASAEHPSREDPTLSRRVLGALFEAILAFGSLEQVSLRLGFGRSFLAGVFRDRSLGYKTFCQILDGLGIQPERFWLWSKASDMPVLDAFGLEAQTILRRNAQLEPIEIAATRRRFFCGELDLHGAAEDRGLIEKLDTCAMSDPETAIHLARSSLQGSRSCAQVASILGYWASASRRLLRLDAAHLILWTSTRLSSTIPNTPALPKQLSRATYLYTSKGEFVRAQEIARLATELLQGSADSDLLGRATYQLANVTYRLGGYDEALPLLRESLTNLSLDSTSYRFGVVHLLGLLQIARGDLPAARNYARAALRLSDTMQNQLAIAKANWLAARVATSENQLVLASNSYETAYRLFRAHPSFDSILLASEFVCVLLRIGKLDNAREVGLALLPSLPGLKDKLSRPFVAAATSLARAMMEVDATVALTRAERILAFLTQASKRNQ